MPGPYTWDDLARATLRRQFPRIRGRGAEAVAELVDRVGPIQSQVARSPFVTVSSRLPGASYDAVTAAYERYAIVRGSSLRGTVHTCARSQHRVVDAVTRRAMESMWRRSLKLERVTVAGVQAAIEAFAAPAWRTPDELRTHLVDWIGEHEGPAAAKAAGTQGVARAMAHIHSGLIRRPMGSGGWDRQTSPGYRTAACVLDDRERDGVDPDAALVQLARQHLRAFGPASRRDIAWWTGERLGAVDAALAALAGELTDRPGPDGQSYYDLEAPLASGLSDPGVRLLPEYDALVVGYDPKARERFLDPAHLPRVWMSANGTFSSAVLADGRLVAAWRIVADRSERRIEVEMFPGVGRLTESDLADQVAAVEKALDAEIADVAISGPA